MIPDKIYIVEYPDWVSRYWVKEKRNDEVITLFHEYIRKDTLLDKLNLALELRCDGNPNSNDNGVQAIKAMINYIESL